MILRLPTSVQSCYKLWGHLPHGEGHFELDSGSLQALKSHMELTLYLKRENMYKFNSENAIHVQLRKRPFSSARLQ